MAQMTRVTGMVSDRLSRLVQQRADPDEKVLYDVSLMVGAEKGVPVASLGVFLGVSCPEIGDEVYSTIHATLTLNSAAMSTEGIDEALGRLWDHVETNRLAMALGLPPDEGERTGGMFVD